jgi:membrane protein
MQAMNMAYHEKEKRNFFHVTTANAPFHIWRHCLRRDLAGRNRCRAADPEGALSRRLSRRRRRRTRWLMMIALFSGCLRPDLSHRAVAPRARWRWIVPGALAAGVVWLVASIAFSAYLENFNAYNATFGSLGAVAALLMWFWLSAYAICMGAELNSQLELFTTQDTTIDAPAKPGQRGAYVADHIEKPEHASPAHAPGRGCYKASRVGTNDAFASSLGATPTRHNLAGQFP